jgi:hypothetical protein
MSVTALAFVLAFFAFGVLAFIRHPIWGLHAYLLVFYMGPESAWWGEALPNLRWSLSSALLTLIAVVMYKAKTQRESWFKYKPIRVLIIFACWLWIQTPWALSTDNHVFLATLFTKYILIFAIIYACLDSEERVHEFLVAHIIGCFWWSYQGWQNHGGGRLEDIGTGDVMGSAFASMHISTALAIAGFMFMSFKGWKKWVPFLAVPFMMNAIILMQTRAAFLGLIAAVPVAFILGPPAKRGLVLFYLALGAGLLFYVADDAFWERMGTIKVEEGQERDASAESRIDLAYANLRMSRDYPMGVGHRGNDLLSPKYVSSQFLTEKEGSRIRSAHNTELAILVDHGWLGILLMVMFHARLMRSILQLRKEMWNAQNLQAVAIASALAAGLVLYWVNGQFANMLKAEVLIWIGATTAAMLSFVQKPETAPAAVRTAARNGRRHGLPAPRPRQASPRG